ncbi:hypothetical protein KCU73_g16318, partial [Aureobasidium melanogenum]
AEGLAEAEKELLTPQETTVSAESESNIPSEDPQVDSAPQDQDIENSPPEDKGPNIPEAAMPEAEKLDGAQSDEVTHDVPGSESSSAQQDKTVEPSTPATEESKNPDNVSETVVEDNDASSNPTNDAVEMTTPEPSIEPAIAEDNTLEAPKDISTSEAIKPDSVNMTGMDPVPSEDIEASSSSDSSATVNEIPPATSAEVVAEPAPTLMALAALILPSNSVSQNTEDAAVTTAVPEALVEVDAAILEPAVESEAPDPVSGVAVVEDSSSKEEVVATNHPDQDSENA